VAATGRRPARRSFWRIFTTSRADARRSYVQNVPERLLASDSVHLAGIRGQYTLGEMAVELLPRPDLPDASTCCGSR